MIESCFSHLKFKGDSCAIFGKHHPIAFLSFKPFLLQGGRSGCLWGPVLAFPPPFLEFAVDCVLPAELVFLREMA
jgi:hypothetical protein